MADSSSGASRLLTGLTSAPRGAAFLAAIQRAVAGHFDVLGEMGKGAGGKIVYLARDLATGGLVALQLTPGPANQTGEMWLDVLRQLDASVPSGEGSCPRCNAELRGWPRFCGQCGADLSGVAAGGTEGTPERLMEAVRAAAGSRYEVLGPMERTDGGGAVYFARENASGRIVALRLERDRGGAGEQYSLGRTMLLDRMVESLAGSAAAPPPAAPVVAMAPEPAASAPPPPAAVPAASAEPDPMRLLLIVGGVMTVIIVLLWATHAGSPRPQPAAVAPTPVVDSGEIQVSGRLPPGAELTLDGEPVSKDSLRLPAGQYALTATAPGFLPVSDTLELDAGETIVWAPRLAPASAKPRPVSRPPVAHRPAAPAAGVPAAGVPAAEASTAGHGHATTPAPASPCATLFGQLDWAGARTACQTEATAGSASAQRSLGAIYERGLGTKADAALAAQWFGRAAEAGDRTAQYRLGLLLLDGHGVKRDPQAAVTWFGRAAEQGDRDAEYALGRVYDRGQGVRKDRTEAAEWYQRAAELGQPDAQYALAVLYLHGDGVARSDADARQWLERAAAQGHHDAADELRHRGWVQ